MDIVWNILIWIHIVAFVIGGTNSVVMPVIGAQRPGATPETQAKLNAIADQLSKFGKFAMVTLLVTGPLILWLKYGFVIPSVWFWVKMALIVVMLVGISLVEINGKKARTGDMAAVGKAKQFGMLTALAFAGVLLSAVFAFG
jgi:putative membrane protein